jgi:hypothetical protein
MVASWSISEEKCPQKNQGTAGLEPATFSFNCHLQNIENILRYICKTYYHEACRKVGNF